MTASIYMECCIKRLALCHVHDFHQAMSLGASPALNLFHIKPYIFVTSTLYSKLKTNLKKAFYAQRRN
jgi:hypothetical protein